MAQIDRIIIRFEVHGGKEAQLILTTLNQVLAQMKGSAGKASAGMMALASSTGVANKQMIVMGNYTSDNILKISEFAVIIFALVGAYKALIGPTVNVEKNMATVKAVSHATGEELKALQKEALRLGTIFPGGAEKATQALVAIGQAGYNTRQSLELLEPVFKLATIGEVDFERAIKLIIPTLNAFNFTTAESGRVIDILASSIGGTLTEVETFEITLPKLSNLANQLNISFEDLVAMIGYLTDSGLPASKVYTALTNVFTQLEKNSLTLKKSLEGTGLSTEQLDIASQGLRRVLETVASANLSAAQKMDLLGIRGFTAGTIIEKDFNKALDEMVEKLGISGEATFQSGAMLDTLAAKFGQLGGTFQETLNSIFEPALVTLKKLVDDIKFFIKVLGNISPAAKEWIKNITGITLALIALSVWLKATKLLVWNFIWGKGIYAAITILKSFYTNIAIVTKSLISLSAGMQLTTGATLALKAALGGVAQVIGSLIVVAGTIAFVKHEIDQFNKSIEGQIYNTDRSIESTRQQIQELTGLRTRLEQTRKSYNELTDAGKDNKQALSDFYDILLDIIEKYPEFSVGILGMAKDFGSMELAVNQVSGAVDTLTAKLQSLLDYAAQLARIEFIGKLKELVPGLEGTELAKRRNWLGLDTWEEVETDKPAEWVEDFFKTLSPVVPKTLDEALGAIAEFPVEYLDSFGKELRKHRPPKVSVEEWEKKVLQFQSAIVSKQIAEAKAALEIPEVPPSGGGGGGGGKTEEEKFKVPGVKEFTSEISYQHAQDALEEINATMYRIINTKKSELAIEKDILQMRWSNNDALIMLHQNRVAELETFKAQLSDEEQIKQVEEEIFNNNINIIKLKMESRNLDLEILENSKAMLNEFFKPAIENITKLWNGWKEVYNSIKDIGQELEDIKTFGELFGADDVSIAKDQLSYMEQQIESITLLMRDLRKETGIWGSLLQFILPILQKLLDELINAYNTLKGETAEKEAAQAAFDEATDIYDRTYESVKDAVAAGIMSGKVKDAVEALGDLIKQAFAEKLAGVIVDKALENLVGGLSLFQGGATSGGGMSSAQSMALAGAGATTATGSAAFMASAVPWIAAGLIGFSMIQNLFESKTAKKIDTKLDYILRGSGYSLPESFVLPEPGEFAWRNRGKDGLSIRFPKRQLDINIKHTFEWQPMELARAIASTISLGGMQSATQFGYVGQ